MIKYISENPVIASKQYQRADWQSRLVFADAAKKEIQSQINNHNEAILDGFGGDEIDEIIDYLEFKKSKLLGKISKCLDKIEFLDSQIHPAILK
jgi:hypothetical protein